MAKKGGKKAVNRVDGLKDHTQSDGEKQNSIPGKEKNAWEAPGPAAFDFRSQYSPFSPFPSYPFNYTIPYTQTNIDIARRHSNIPHHLHARRHPILHSPRRRLRRRPHHSFLRKIHSRYDRKGGGIVCYIGHDGKSIEY